MAKKVHNNLAFIDGQNLHLGTTKSEPTWKIDLKKFRIFLKDKYRVEKAYYFLGCMDESERTLYANIQEAGFIVMFREHNAAMVGKKKGNVDTDIVFSIMEKMYNQEDFNQIVLVSGDGDYIRLVNFLIEKGKVAKILFPNQKYASSLYKKLGSKYFDYLDKVEIKAKIAYKQNERGS